jgi:hypothetical protein
MNVPKVNWAGDNCMSGEICPEKNANGKSSYHYNVKGTRKAIQ